MTYYGTSDAILVYDHKVLLFLRDNRPEVSDPNAWCLPGGKLEEGETHDQGLRRELQEEIGLVPSEHPMYVGQLIGPDGRSHRIYFGKLTKEEAEEVRLGDEGQELRFFGFDELAALKMSKKIGIMLQDHPEAVRAMLEKEVPPRAEGLGLTD